MALSCIFTIPTFCILVSYGFASDIEKSRSVHWAIKSGSYYSAGNAQAKPSSARNSRASKVQSNGRGISSLIGSKFSPEQTKNIEKITLVASSTCSWTVVLVLVFMFIFYPMKCSITQTSPEYDKASDVLVQPYANICQSENQIYWFLALTLAHCALAAFGLLVAWTMKQSKLHKFLNIYNTLASILINCLVTVLCAVLILIIFKDPTRQQLIVSCIAIVISSLSSVIYCPKLLS